MVKGRVDDAVAKGAKVLAGGEADGAVLPGDAARRRAGGLRVRAARDVRPGRSRSRSSTSADEAVARANATSYGLGAGIITSDADRGLALAQQIESGIVHVNDQPVGDEPQMPFGGVKDSRLGALRRAGGDRRVHRAALDHGAERHATRSRSDAGGRAIVPLADAVARARPRRRRRRARGLHAPDPARRRPRADPAGAARADAGPDDAGRRSTTS